MPVYRRVAGPGVQRGAIQMGGDDSGVIHSHAASTTPAPAPAFIAATPSRLSRARSRPLKCAVMPWIAPTFPRQRHPRQPRGLPMSGQSVQKRVGRRASLPRRTHRSGDRGTQHNIDNPRSRVNSCRIHAASTSARSTVSTRSGVSEVITASSSTPAAWFTRATAGTVDAAEPRLHRASICPSQASTGPEHPPGPDRGSAQRSTWSDSPAAD